MLDLDVGRVKGDRLLLRSESDYIEVNLPASRPRFRSRARIPAYKRSG